MGMHLFLQMSKGHIIEDFNGSRASHLLSQWYHINVRKWLQTHTYWPYILRTFIYLHIHWCTVCTGINVPAVVLSSCVDSIHRQMHWFLQGLSATSVEHGESCSLSSSMHACMYVHSYQRTYVHIYVALCIALVVLQSILTDFEVAGNDRDAVRDIEMWVSIYMTVQFYLRTVSHSSLQTFS